MGDAFDCDTFIGSKRTISEIEEALLQEPSAIPVKEDSKDSCFLILPSPTEIIQDIPSPSSFKKVRCSFRNPVAVFEDNGEKNAERAFLDDTDAVSVGKIGAFVVEEKETESRLSLEHKQEKVDDEGCKDVTGETKTEGAAVEYQEYDENGEVQIRCVVGENSEFPVLEESLVKEKKKQLLAEVEVGSIFKEKAGVGNIHGCDADAGILSLNGLNNSATGSWKIELIDDTVLVGPLLLSEAGTGGVEVGRKKNVKKETEGKKVKRPRRKGKGVSKAYEMTGMHKKETQCSDAQTGCGGNVYGMKRRYSRGEMEDLRFVNIVEQRKLWMDIYTGLGNAVANEYEDLGSSKHQKNVRFNGPRQLRSYYDVPLGVVATRGPMGSFECFCTLKSY